MPVDKGFRWESIGGSKEVAPYYPENEKEALNYILHHGFIPEVDAYQGHPDVQRGLAQALGLYHPGEDLTKAIDDHVGVGNESTAEQSSTTDELAERRQDVAKKSRTVFVVNVSPVVEEAR